MATNLTPDDIDREWASKVFVQEYKDKSIDGVKVVNLVSHTTEDGDFSELVRFSEDGSVESLPELKVMQVNRSRVFPGSIKAWHLHYDQDEGWYVSPFDHLVVGLWDLRENSPTKGKAVKISLGHGNSRILYIPRGVAHGLTNLIGRPVDLTYFVSNKFNAQNPDEKRLPWDSLDAEFWSPPKE